MERYGMMAQSIFATLNWYDWLDLCSSILYVAWWLVYIRNPTPCHCNPTPCHCADFVCRAHVRIDGRWMVRCDIIWERQDNSLPRRHQASAGAKIKIVVGLRWCGRVMAWTSKRRWFMWASERSLAIVLDSNVNMPRDIFLFPSLLRISAGGEISTIIISLRLPRMMLRSLSLVSLHGVDGMGRSDGAYGCYDCQSVSFENIFKAQWAWILFHHADHCSHGIDFICWWGENKNISVDIVCVGRDNAVSCWQQVDVMIGTTFPLESYSRRGFRFTNLQRIPIALILSVEQEGEWWCDLTVYVGGKITSCRVDLQNFTK